MRGSPHLSSLSGIFFHHSLASGCPSCFPAHFQFLSLRHGNAWYSLANESTGLFKLEKTAGEAEKSILPFAQGRRDSHNALISVLLRISGFLVICSHLGKLQTRVQGPGVVWSLYRMSARHELSQRDARLHVFSLQKPAMSEAGTIWSVKHHVALELLLLKWESPTNHNAVPALLPRASPLCGAGKVHLFSLAPTTLFYSIPAYPTALLLMDWHNWLFTHRLEVSVFSSASLFPCLHWGHVIFCGNVEGRTGKTNDPRRKHMALHLFWEAETETHVKSSTENLVYFCTYTFQLLLSS